MLDSQALEEKKAFLLFFQKGPSRAPGILFLLYFVFSNGQQQLAAFYLFCIYGCFLLEVEEEAIVGLPARKEKEGELQMAPLQWEKEKGEISNIVGALKWTAFSFFILLSLSLTLSPPLSRTLAGF